MRNHSHNGSRNEVWKLMLLIPAMSAWHGAMTGCAAVVGGAAGAATGYVAGHEAGKHEADEEIEEHDRTKDDR